jgi:lipopolysaccharide export system ATP-binding protein
MRTADHSETRVLLRADGLRWHCAGRWIVDGVDLEIRGGEIVGLLGPNGAGKTVTLSMIAGLLDPTSGELSIRGAVATHLPLHERARMGLGFLPQERSVFRKMTALENIAAVLETRDVDRRTAMREARRLLHQFGLAHVADTRAAQLSGGEQRRLEVARCLAIEPSVLLFDEPFAGIDPLTIESLHRILVSLRGSGVGILLTDHNVRETFTLCDRAYVLFDGKVLAHGTPDELLHNDEVRDHFLGGAFELVGRPAGW